VYNTEHLFTNYITSAPYHKYEDMTDRLTKIWSKFYLLFINQWTSVFFTQASLKINQQSNEIQPCAHHITGCHNIDVLLHGSLHQLHLSLYSTSGTNFIHRSAATITNMLFSSQCNKTTVACVQQPLHRSHTKLHKKYSEIKKVLFEKRIYQFCNINHSIFQFSFLRPFSL